MAINRKWHMANRMPRNPSAEQRIKWHLAHEKNCACRETPAKIVDEMRSRGIRR